MSTSEKQSTVTNLPGLDSVTLDEPVQRGDQTITTVQLRKPKAGELRGISLSDLAELDVAALQRVLPRITIPSLTQQEVDALELCDLTALGAKVATFLLKKADRV